MPPVVEGLDADAVAGHEQGLFAAIPESEGEHAVEVGQAVWAPFFVGVQNRLAV